jgi:hypothetical protein
MTVVGGPGSHARNRIRERTPLESVLITALVGTIGIVAALVLFATMGLGPGGPGQPIASPTTGPPAVSASPLASDVPATPGPAPTDVAGSDPADLPRFPGSVRTGHEQGVDGRIRWSLIRYAAAAPPDEVREHYRAALRDHGWFVGDVGFDGGRWLFDANRDSREVTLELTPGAAHTLVSAYLSEPIERPRRTARPPAPRRTSRPEADRQNRRDRPDRPDRPARDRGGDDDDDDDEDDDDGGDD